MKYLLLMLCATAAFAQHPDSLSVARYGEPTFPLTKKTFRHVRLGNQVNDTSQYVWNAFGKVGETEDGITVFGYQLQWNRMTATFYFVADDSSLHYFPNMHDTEDSDAVFEIRIPIEKDHHWQYKLSDSIIATIIDDNATVTVPAGTYEHCIVTQVKDGDDTTTRSFAPDIGMIKMKTVGAEFSKLVDLISIRKP